MTNTCPVCQCEQAEGLLCHADTSALERDLGDVAAIVAELDVTLSKQARIGNGGTAGLARERTPIDVGAMQAADNLGNVLTTWARDVVGEGRLRSVAHPTHSYAAAWILLGEIPAIRRHPAVVELVDEITDAIRQARRAVDRPADRVYLGQCLAPTPDDEGREVTCLAELYARPNASEVVCRVCGAEQDVHDRRMWLLEKASEMLVTVKEASSYLGEIGGIPITQASIRGLLHRGQRLAYRPPLDAKRFRLGDLLDALVEDRDRKSA